MMEASSTTKATPVLPVEILEAIIDQLHTDLRMLGICALVCLEWSIRSRYHVFSAIQLSPWRARRFFELCRTKHCTFVNFVNYIDVDGAQTSEGCLPSHDPEFSFYRILSLSSSFLTYIKSLRIRNVNWTLLSPAYQNQLRQHLTSFTELRILEFDNVTFHDPREIVQITSSFPFLSDSVINVKFSKYLQYAISSAVALTLPSNLRTLRLGTDEAIPVLLNTTVRGSRISRLILDGVKLWHVQYIGSGLQNLREVLRHLQINFSRSKVHPITINDLAQLDLTHHTNIRSLHFGGIVLKHRTVSCALERGLPCPARCGMTEINLNLIVESEPMVRQSWCALERVFAAMTHCRLNLDISVCPSPAGSELTTDEAVENIYSELKGLQSMGGMGICVNVRGID